jgi:hypothetical protein
VHRPADHAHPALAEPFLQQVGTHTLGLQRQRFDRAAGFALERAQLIGLEPAQQAAPQVGLLGGGQPLEHVGIELIGREVPHDRVCQNELPWPRSLRAALRRPSSSLR